MDLFRNASRVISFADFFTSRIPLDAIFLAIAIPSVIDDFRSYRIPDCIVYPGFFVLVAGLAIAIPTQLIDSLIAAALAVSFLWIIRKMTKGLGLGDVKFGACMGLYCGTRAIFIAFLIAALSGILVAAIRIRVKNMNKTTRIPFAPYLALGAISARVIADFFCR